jgi:hypothetical protein
VTEVSQDEFHQVGIELSVLVNQEKSDIKITNEREVLDFFDFKVRNVTKPAILF